MWVVRLTDKQLEVLRALLRSEEHLGPALLIFFLRIGDVSIGTCRMLYAMRGRRVSSGSASWVSWHWVTSGITT